MISSRCLTLITSILLIHSFQVISEDENIWKDHQTDFCLIHEKIESRLISIKDALKGMTISAASSYDVAGVENPAIAVRILNEIARRGGFEIEYANTGRPGINETWTDVLMRNTQYYDIACDWWERRINRLDRGLVFAEEWYDADTIMIRKPNPPAKNTFNFWAFAQPFSPGLWIMILFIVNATGVVYYFLDYLKSKAIGAETDTNFLGSVFFSFHAFTGHCNYTAKSMSSQILTTSMCFLYLILISAYTANLANFFIAQNIPEVVIDNINDVVRNKMSLCVLRGFPFTEIIKKKYPNADLIYREREEETLVALSNGVCDIGLSSVEQWKTLSRDSAYNLECDLEWVGRRVDVVPAGFALEDSSNLCTSLLTNVLNYHIIAMKADGKMEEIWEDFRSAASTATCDQTPRGEDAITKKTRIQLNVKNMTGAFAFHFCFVAAAIILALYEFYNHPKELKKQIKGDFLASFEEAMKSTGFSRFEGSVSGGGGAGDLFSDNDDVGASKRVSLKSLTVVKDLCSTLSPEDMNNLILQNQILFSQKLEYILSLTQRNRALFCRKFDDQSKILNQLKEELDESKQKMN